MKTKPRKNIERCREKRDETWRGGRGRSRIAASSKMELFTITANG